MENEKEKKDKLFFTAEELVEKLRGIYDPKASKAKTAITQGELEHLLARVKGEEIGLASIKGATIDALKTYKKHNEHGQGLTAPHLWTYIRREGAEIPYDLFKMALDELIEEEEVYKTPGMLTAFLPGKDPNKKEGEVLEENTSPEQVA